MDYILDKEKHLFLVGGNKIGTATPELNMEDTQKH